MISAYTFPLTHSWSANRFSKEAAQVRAGAGPTLAGPSQAARGADGAAAARPSLPSLHPHPPRDEDAASAAGFCGGGRGTPCRPRSGSPSPSLAGPVSPLIPPGCWGAGMLGEREAVRMLRGCRSPAAPSSHRNPIKLRISMSRGSQSRPWRFPCWAPRLRLIWNLSAEDFPQRPPVPTASGELADGYANFIIHVHNCNLGVGKLFR